MRKKIDIPKNSILGLHYSGMHDSSITVLSNSGEIVFASSLERFTRVKGDGRFPFELLELLPIENISTVALTNAKEYIVPESNESKIHPIRLKHSLISNRSHSPIWKEQIESFFYNKEIKYFNHHLCHASSSFYASDFNEAICLIYDGGMSNEHYFGGVYFASKEDGIEPIDLFSAQEYSNITYLYMFVTALLGFKPLRHEGKITGLAAFGKVNIECKKVLESLLYEPKFLFQWLNMYEYDNIPNLSINHKQKELYLKQFLRFSKEDIAATLQNITEEHIYKILQNLKNKGIESKNICLSGGLFANVKVNQRVFEFGFENIFISPPMGDDGTSLGAAYLCLEKGKRKKIQFNNVYLGYKEDKVNLKKIIKENNIKLLSIEQDNISSFIAKKLAEGKIFAIFQNSAEFGPRALGNRTILAPATQKSINDGLNKKLGRTEFMPFAPIVRDIDVDKYFKLKDGEKNTARFMTITCYCTNLARRDVSAVVHIDNTARPQIVLSKDNPLIYDILTEYSKLTNIFALVNTSFNIHGEPIVNSYVDAIRGFFEAGLDYLYIDGSMVSLEENKDIYIKYLKEKVYKTKKALKEQRQEKEKYISYFKEQKRAKEELKARVEELTQIVEKERAKQAEIESKNQELLQTLKEQKQVKEELESKIEELTQIVEKERAKQAEIESKNQELLQTLKEQKQVKEELESKIEELTQIVEKERAKQAEIESKNNIIKSLLSKIEE